MSKLILQSSVQYLFMNFKETMIFKNSSVLQHEDINYLGIYL